ncbi:MAG TPA: hypothetical protein VGJ21_09365 [Terracidiphilus sp.]|jgi:hypothetical protein
MSRVEPPPFASWIVEHLIPGQRDQALPGDLMEAFQVGRSNGWYWRQALAALAVGWAKYLGDRASLIVFAIMWSMLAPAWTAIIDRVQSRNAAWPVSVAAWLALNLAYLWTGMLLFAALHRRTAVAVNTAKLKRACAVAAGVFLPAYFATFILMNLFAWPGIALDWRRLSPLAEIADFRILADVLRVPYIVTILWSMWRITPALAVISAPVVEWPSKAAAPADQVSAPRMPRRDPLALARLLLLMLGAGLLNAMIAGVLLCRLPEANHATITSLVARGALYVLIGALAGVMGTYVYWNYPSGTLRENPPIPFSLFALICAAGWVWVPALVLFSEQATALTAWVALIASWLVSGELRRMAFHLLPQQPQLAPNLSGEQHLFAESLHRSPSEPYGYLITFCLYGAGWAIADRSYMTSAALLALAACVFKARTVARPRQLFQEGREYRRAALRLSMIVLPAVFVTIWALLDGLAYRNRMAGIGNGAGAVVSATASKKHARLHSDTKSSTHAGRGFESVVLWPYPQKKQIVAPVVESPLLAPGTHEPAVIRFDGQYWYLQPPDERPGPSTHQAQGTPLDVHIASANSFPLMMEAHEFLRSPIRVARCREIRIEIDNRDDQAGFISMAVWLKNSSLSGAPAVYLGQQPIRGIGDIPYTGKGTGNEQSIAFPVPAGAKVRSFDEIAVMMLPDKGHQQVGPRIAIEQFELMPR